MGPASRYDKILVFGVALILSGCGSNEFMPLELGLRSSYTVRTLFTKSVAQLEAKKVVSVSGARGFVVSGPLGESRMAWKDGSLIADRLGSTSFSPAIPLLSPTRLTEKISWTGKVASLTGTEDGTATLTQAKSSLSVGGRKFNTIKATLVLDTPKRQVELESEFAPGVGLVRQRQHTNGKFDLEIELLSGK